MYPASAYLQTPGLNEYDLPDSIQLVFTSDYHTVSGADPAVILAGSYTLVRDSTYLYVGTINVLYGEGSLTSIRIALLYDNSSTPVWITQDLDTLLPYFTFNCLSGETGNPHLEDEFADTYTISAPSGSGVSDKIVTRISACEWSDGENRIIWKTTPSFVGWECTFTGWVDSVLFDKAYPQNTPVGLYYDDLGGYSVTVS